MPKGLLIGFEYKFNSLPGALVDLYHAKKWCDSFECISHVITDIEKNMKEENLKEILDNQIADDGFKTFYDNIESLGIVKDESSLLSTIENFLKKGIPDNKLVIYYTGHGVKDCLVMPNRNLLPIIEFRDTILNNINHDVEIFFILDCCNPSGMNLPYKLVRNEFSLSPKKIECVLQPILMITSSEHNEKSVATKFGSLFSRNLFKILSRLTIKDNNKNFRVPIHKNRNLQRLIGMLSSSIKSINTGFTQTVSVYSSYVIDPVLWMWIGGQSDIVGDITMSSLIIRSKNELHYFNPYDLLYGST